MRSVILCVDDDKYVLQALWEQLNEWFSKNYIIEKSLGGEEALFVIDDYIGQNVAISVIISDYIMPVMRGDEFLQKAHEKDPYSKKIMLTGYSALEGVVNAINKAGLYRFISKPWDNKDLMLTILEAIKSFEQAQTMNRFSTNVETFYSQHNEMIKNLQTSYEATVSILMSAIEKRFQIHTSHCEAVKYYAVELAKILNANKEDIFLLSSLGMLHEAGKISFTDAELAELETARKKLDYANPIVKKMLERTCLMFSNVANGSYTSALIDLYKPFDPKLPLPTRILSVANTFDNIISHTETTQAAYAMLLKYAENGLLDPEITKLLIKKVPVYKNAN